MFFFNENYISPVVISIFFLVLFTFKDLHFSNNHSQKNGKQRFLFENLNKVLPEKLNIYDYNNFHIPNFVEIKLKNNNNQDIEKSSDENEKNYDYKKKCEDNSKNLLNNIYKKIKKIFGVSSFDTEECINNEKHKKFNENFNYFIENNLSIGITPVCLIDTGINTKDSLIKHFLKYENKNEDYDLSSFELETNYNAHYGINTEICNEYNYSYCESSNLEDTDNHGTYVANTIIKSELLKEKKVFKKSTRLVACKAFGSKMDSHLIPLIKCLEYCKMKNVKIIHVSYNIYEKNEKLIEIMDDLEKSQIIVVSPTHNIYNKKTKSKNNDDEYNKKRFYPSSFSEKYENVFSIGALKYSQEFKSDKIKAILLNNDDKKVLNMENTTLFNFTYRTNLSEKKDSDIEYSSNYASASFVNTLIIMLNINPKLSISKIRDILKKSIVVENDLKPLSNWGGYINVSRVINDSLKDRKKFYKLFYMDIYNDKQQRLYDMYSTIAPNTRLLSKVMYKKANGQMDLDKTYVDTDNDLIEYNGSKYITKEKENKYDNHNDNSLMLVNDEDIDYKISLDIKNEDIPQKRKDKSSLNIENEVIDDDIDTFSNDFQNSQNEMFFDNSETFNNNKKVYDYSSDKDKYNLNETYSYGENAFNYNDPYAHPSYNSFLQMPYNDEIPSRNEEYMYQNYEDNDYIFDNNNKNNVYKNSNYENIYRNSNNINEFNKDQDYENNEKFYNYALHELDENDDYKYNKNNYKDDNLSLFNQNNDITEDLSSRKKRYTPYLEESINYRMAQPYVGEIDEQNYIYTKKNKLTDEKYKNTSRSKKNPKVKKRNQKREKLLSKKNKSRTRSLSKKAKAETEKPRKMTRKKIKKRPKKKNISIESRQKKSKRVPLKKRSSLKNRQKKLSKRESELKKIPSKLPRKKGLIKNTSNKKQQKKFRNKI